MCTLVCFEIDAHEWDYHPKKNSGYNVSSYLCHLQLLPTSSWTTHSSLAFFFFFETSIPILCLCESLSNSSRWLLGGGTPLHLQDLLTSWVTFVLFLFRSCDTYSCYGHCCRTLLWLYDLICPRQIPRDGKAASDSSHNSLGFPNIFFLV